MNFIGSTANTVAIISSVLCRRFEICIKPSLLPHTNTRPPWNIYKYYILHSCEKNTINAICDKWWNFANIRVCKNFIFNILYCFYHQTLQLYNKSANGYIRIQLNSEAQLVKTSLHLFKLDVTILNCLWRGPIILFHLSQELWSSYLDLQASSLTQ